MSLPPLLVQECRGHAAKAVTRHLVIRVPHTAQTGIDRVFHPLEVPQLIAESFDQLLATAAAINDPFEQARSSTTTGAHRTRRLHY